MLNSLSEIMGLLIFCKELFILLDFMGLLILCKELFIFLDFEIFGIFKMFLLYRGGFAHIQRINS